MPFTSGLAEYLDTLYTDYKTAKSAFERKCQMNLNSFKGIDNTRWKVEEAEGWRSKAYYKFIKIKVMAAYGLLTDFLLQGGKIPFNLKSTPYQKPVEAGQEIDETEAVDGMTDKIKEQLVDRKADRHTLKKIFSLVLYGMSWSKYSVDEHKSKYFERHEPEGMDAYPDELRQFVTYESVDKVEVIPGHEYRSVWSILWDFEEDDVQKMQGIFEHDVMSAFDLMQMKGEPDYYDDAISKVISEHKASQDNASDESLPPGKREAHNRRKDIKWKQYWGRAPRRIVDDFDRDIRGKEKKKNVNDPAGVLDQWTSMEDPENRSGDDIEILTEMAGDEVIRLVRVEGDVRRPYKKCVMEEDLDETTGKGTADGGEDVQVLLNGAIRAFVDNKALSANVTAAIKERYFIPGTFDSTKPGKNIPIDDDCDDVRKAYQQIIIQDVGESLVSMINLMLQFGDDATQIPQILHSFNAYAGGKSRTPETAFQSNQLQENSGKYLGQVIRNYDESHIEPEITDIYEYNMEDPDCPQEIKCSCKVHATGFTSFQNKVIRANTIMELLALIMSDESGELRKLAKIEKHLTEIYKAKDIDPDEFLKSEDEQAQDAEEEQAAMEAQMAAEEAARQAEIDAEIQVKEVEIDGKIQLEDVESQNDREEAEEDFQRDVLLKAIDSTTQPEKKAVNQ